MQDLHEYLPLLIGVQEAGYKNTLALLGLIELLVEKNIISPDELARKTAVLNGRAFAPPARDGA